jgi:hypothetical protein
LDYHRLYTHGGAHAAALAKYYGTTGASKVNRRKFHSRFLIPNINASLTAVVAEVANSVLKVFDGCEYSPEQIKNLLPSFRISGAA